MVAEAFNDSQRLACRVMDTHDRDLLTLELRSGEEKVEMYFDVSNTRFWIMHSMGKSEIIDRAVDKLVRSGPRLDRTWFAADLLEAVSELGSFRGLGLDYDRRPVPDVDFDHADAPVEFLKMQLWGNKAPSVLSVLRKEGAFPSETTLSKVKVKYWLNHGSEADIFSVDDVKFDGKITARGTSFESHIALVSSLKSVYAGNLRRLEDAYTLRLRRASAGHASIEGGALYFHFSRPIADLSRFAEFVLSGSHPFRLWAVPQMSKSGKKILAKVVDMHVGSRIDLEIRRDMISLYLRPDACGNSVMRFYTNLQHHYDALVQVSDADGLPVFQFQFGDGESVDSAMPRGPASSRQY
jgi:hypothetical protein